jgi:hypothetical protein
MSDAFERSSSIRVVCVPTSNRGVRRDECGRDDDRSLRSIGQTIPLIQG